ncbi:MAG: hypothetical protein RJB66_1403 [Pseudomonadota bacterium]|jgi:hypothetical protein
MTMGLNVLRFQSGSAFTGAIIFAALAGVIGFVLFSGIAQTIKIDTLHDMKSYQGDLYGEILFDVSTANCGVTTLRDGAQPSFVKVTEPTSVGIISNESRKNDGIESNLLSIYQGSIFKNFQVKAIFFMAYDGSESHLQGYLIQNNCAKKSYCPINSTKTHYLAQIGVVFDSPKHGTVDTILKYPVIIDVNDEGAVTKCVSAKQNSKEFCLASDGEWKVDDFKCSFKKLNPTDGGSGGFCALSESCNVNKNYRWPI